MAKAYSIPSFSEEELATETWLPAPGLSGAYEVSSLGRVARVRKGGERAVRVASVRNRYLGVNLPTPTGTRTVKVHHLVAAAFHGERPAGLQANHKDGDRFNNRASNLEWVTRERNLEHYLTELVARRGGSCRHSGSFRENNLPPGTKLNPDAVRTIRTRRAGGEMLATLSREYGVSYVTVWNACAGHSWRWVDAAPAA